MLLTIDGKRYYDREPDVREVSLTLDEVRQVFEGIVVKRCLFCAQLTVGQLAKLFPDPMRERYMSSHGQLAVRIGKRIHPAVAETIVNNGLRMSFVHLRKIIKGRNEAEQRQIMKRITLSW